MSTIQLSPRVRQRITAVLFLAQSFFSASTIAAFTLSPIIAAQLSGSEAAAGFPNTMGMVGRAAFAYPMGFLMDRVGRRIALSTGYSLAIVGAAISVLAILSNSFLLFLLGALLLGMSRAAGDQSRYVGAEVYPLVHRARIIGFLVFAGTFGAIAGPQLVPWSSRMLEMQDLPGYVGPFVVAAMLMLLATLTVFLFLRPDPRELGRLTAAEEAQANSESIENVVKAGEERPLWAIFSAPMVQLALLSMVIGYFVMVFLMVITSLHMAHHGHGTTAIANVIMGHTLGMYGLSFVTGWLIDRLGRVPMIVAGSVVLALSCLLAPLSLHMMMLALALFLLGLGWNFCFVAGSSLLSDALAASERGRGQGVSEALVALAAGSASLSVGAVFQWGDYWLVSMIGLAFSLGLLLITAVLVRQQQQASPVVEAIGD